MNNAKLSATAVQVLAAIVAGAAFPEAIAEQSGLSKPQVNTSLSHLKRGGLADVVKGKLKVTADGRKELRAAQKATTVTSAGNPNSTKSKADVAREIFSENPNASRKVLMNRFQAEAGLTPAGANTYIHNFRKSYATA